MRYQSGRLKGRSVTQTAPFHKLKLTPRTGYIEKRPVFLSAVMERSFGIAWTHYGTILRYLPFPDNGRLMMTRRDILTEDVAELASRLEAMTDDEVFTAMRTLESHSEDESGDRDEILSRIALVEEELERRFPGQLLAPYRTWKKDQSLI